MKKLIMTVLIVLYAMTAWAQTDRPVTPAQPTLSTITEYPVRGQSTDVMLSGIANPNQWQATFTYRPNSETAITSEPMAFDENGMLHWKPRFSGIVQINAKGPGDKDKSSINVAVRFPSPPISGIVILLVAGTILFSGAGWSLVLALKEK